MIVKIQISQNDDGSMVLVYNQSRSFMQQFEATPELKKIMGDQPRLFFEATIVEDELRLRESLPYQGW